MNVFDFMSPKEGVIGFAITNMNWELFSKESHDFQCGLGFDSVSKKCHPKDFEKAMEQKGYEIIVYVPTETADWWRND